MQEVNYGRYFLGDLMSRNEGSGSGDCRTDDTPGTHGRGWRGWVGRRRERGRPTRPAAAAAAELCGGRARIRQRSAPHSSAPARICPGLQILISSSVSALLSLWRFLQRSAPEFCLLVDRFRCFRSEMFEMQVHAQQGNLVIAQSIGCD